MQVLWARNLEFYENPSFVYPFQLLPHHYIEQLVKGTRKKEAKERMKRCTEVKGNKVGKERDKRMNRKVIT